jgi:hypothetical protein
VRKRGLRSRASVPLRCLAAVAALIALPVASASAAEVNATGTWQAVYHCEQGNCAGHETSGTFELQQAAGSSTVSGTLRLLTGQGTVTGTLSGSTLTLSGTGERGYTATGVETISADGLSWTGSFSDNQGTSGTLTATRPSLPILNPANLKPSAIQVICNLEVLPAVFTCEVEVSEAREGANPIVTIPTGSVSFSAPFGGFSPLPQCQLASTPGAGTTATCSVTYSTTTKIPIGKSPPVTASYSGSSVLAPSVSQAGLGAVVSAIIGATKVTGEGVKATVSCPAGTETGACSTRAELALYEAGGGVITARNGSSPKPKKIVIASTKLTLERGKSRVVTISLNPNGRKLLAKHKRLTALLKVSINGVVAATKVVQLRYAHRR